MAKLIKTDESTIDIQPENNSDFTLEECYKHIGCSLIEVVDLLNGDILICDEEGLLKSNPIQNMTASLLASSAYKRRMFIVGNVILCKREELK